MSAAPGEGPDLTGRAVLITGGAGFIGSNLAIRLVELGAEVTIVDSLVPEYGGNVANLEQVCDRLTLNISDVRDEYSLAYLIAGKDILFNLAGQTSHLDSMSDPFTDLEINGLSQLHILEAARRINPGIRIVFASTRQFYGRPKYLPVDEEHPLRPVDINGVNKLAGELYHLLYHQVYDIATTALRLTNTYGPRMRIKDARQTFLGIWIRLALEGRPFEVWEGGQLRDFTYVDDAVDALLRRATEPAAIGQVFNLGGLEHVTLTDVAELLAATTGGQFEIREYPSERKRIDIGHYYADWSKIEAAVGWKPTTPLSTGLGMTVEYYRERLEQYR